MFKLEQRTCVTWKKSKKCVTDKQPNGLMNGLCQPAYVDDTLWQEIVLKHSVAQMILGEVGIFCFFSVSVLCPQPKQRYCIFCMSHCNVFTCLSVVSLGPLLFKQIKQKRYQWKCIIVVYLQNILCKKGLTLHLSERTDSFHYKCITNYWFRKYIHN